MAYLEQKKPIAETGIQVSPLGLGTVKIGRDKAVKYPDGFQIPEDKQVIALLEQAWESGINLIDTAPAYGRSEQRLGQLLKKVRREWVIATKAGEYFDAVSGESHYDFTPESLIKSIENSLKTLQQDALDIVLIHSDGNDEHIIRHHGALEVLADLKQRGWIRASGISTKTVTGGMLTLEQSDIAMVMHNLQYQEEQAVIEQAAKLNKGIFIKKALGSGHLAKQAGTDTVQDNFDFIFNEPAVSSVIIGTINPTHLHDNINKAVKALAQ